ncbi:MAG TPA: hypothetical protein VKU37_01870 [Verrucomicrobiae bacterium]|nr:hypothetical protein [Verrucomicrobiae bacterium]
MTRFLLFFSAVVFVAANRVRSEVVIADVFARRATSLNGDIEL